MIDGLELLRWAETAKILSVRHSAGTDGKFYYGVPFVDLRRQICALEGITVKEVIGDGRKEDEKAEN